MRQRRSKRARPRAKASIALALSLAACSTRESRRDPAPAGSPPGSSAAPPPVPTPARPDCPIELSQARQGGSDADRYVVPSQDEWLRARSLVEQLAREGASSVDSIRGDATALGLEIAAIDGQSSVFVLRERPDNKRGGGAYLFRLGARAPLIVQAPHTFYDEGTFPLACDLFRESNALALFIDTAHRYKAHEADEEGKHPADVAHATGSLFHAATEGVLRANPRITVIQLHGFSPRESGAAIVLSNGTSAQSGEVVSRVAHLLSAVVPGKVERFPEEASELGATTNVQGRAVRAAGGTFLHIEMSAPLRQTLLTEAELRASVFRALLRGALPP